MTTTQPVGQLDSYFVNLINNIMLLERQPLKDLQTQRDTINVQRGAYSDLSTRLNDLQLSTRTLISTDAFYAVKPGRSSQVTNAPTDTSVLSATVSSGAVAGNYDFTVTKLAKAERVASAEQSSIDQALGKSGSILLGGNGTADVTGGGGSVQAVALSSLADGAAELGSGDYTVEVREYEGKLQFHVKNGDGNVVSIADKTQTDGSLTTSWQNLTAGETYDTQRGFSITFSDTPAAGQSTVHYTAAGATVSVGATDSLIDIVNKINKSNQPDGQEVQATIVGNQMVFTAAHTGTDHTLQYSMTGGLDFGTFTPLQDAANAEFSVNNILFTRQSNTNLTDVISGATVNLANDAEGKSASLVISEDTSQARSAIDDFVSQFNDILGYLAQSTSVTKNSDGTYTRGTLAGDSIFSELRGDLFYNMMDSYATGGSFTSLRDIGITIGDDLTLSVSDSDKLNKALTSNFDDVTKVLDQAMGKVNTTLGRFTGNSGQGGYLDSALTGIDDQISSLNDQIDTLSGRLDDRQQSLVNQYSQMQAQLLNLTYMQQTISSINSGISRLF
jgi:flagellar capping protein FliD